MEKAFALKNIFVKRFAPGEDLLESITRWAKAERVSTAMVSLIGALTRFHIGYYDQKQREYVKFTGEGDFEILHCTGNISPKEGKPFPHLHIMLAGKDGRAFGGHLFEGSKIFVAEAVIQVFDGNSIARIHNEETGLALWPLNPSAR